MTVLSFRPDKEDQVALEALCKATERDQAYHLRRALERYLKENEWQIQTGGSK